LKIFLYWEGSMGVNNRRLDSPCGPEMSFQCSSYIPTVSEQSPHACRKLLLAILGKLDHADAAAQKSAQASAEELPLDAIHGGRASRIVGGGGLPSFRPGGLRPMARRTSFPENNSSRLLKHFSTSVSFFALLEPHRNILWDTSPIHLNSLHAATTVSIPPAPLHPVSLIAFEFQTNT
jgi:hypothetical protein